MVGLVGESAGALGARFRVGLVKSARAVSGESDALGLGWV